MSSHRCMKIAPWSVAVLIKLFIRFPLESQRPWAAQNQTMFLYLCLWGQFGWAGVLLSSRFLKFHVEMCWRKKKQLRIGGIGIHVRLLVKQRGGCLRAPGGGGGVVFPACVKWCLLELSGVRTRPDLPQGRATAPCKQLAPVYVSRHFDVSSSPAFSSLTLKYFIHRIHVAWNGCCRSQAPLWVTHTFSSDSVSPLKFVRSAEALRARGGAGQAPDGLAGIVPPSGGHLR